MTPDVTHGEIEGYGNELLNSSWFLDRVNIFTQSTFINEGDGLWQTELHHEYTINKAQLLPFKK